MDRPSENGNPQKPAAEDLETSVTVCQLEIDKKEQQQPSSTENLIEVGEIYTIANI